jgi:hypothetical protein
MGLLQTRSLKLMLLLALTLPLQSFAAAWNCGSAETGPVAAHQHCAPGSGALQTGDRQHHHCGICCAAAIAALPFGWMAPRMMAPGIVLTQTGSPPKVVLDRLDRPPRLL